MISKNQIKEVCALHSKKNREERNQFISEGVKIVEEILLHDPQIIKELFVTNEYILRSSQLITKKKVPYTVVTPDELKRISTLASPNMVLAVCNYLEVNLTNFDFTSNFSIYLDQIRDPGNLGTVLRMADWFGIPEIFCSPDSTDVYNPKVIQSAMGAFLRVKVNYIDLGELLFSKKIPVYGAVMSGQNLYDQPLKNGLIVIGNESNGISANNLSLVTQPITIPAAKQNKTESLNAAVAAAIICSEFFRQLKQ